MSSFGFDNINENENKVYLREAGLHENARFLGLSYAATESYEYFDIEIECLDGRYFRERTFGPNIDKVYPKDIYKNNVKVGLESKQQAFDRVQSDINTKLFHLALCFSTKENATDKVANIKTLKELVDAVNKAIGKPEGTINFLTIWKNSDTKQKSNLIIAERIRWCEPYIEGRVAGIRLSKWQTNNQLVEKYPFIGTNESNGSDAPILSNGNGNGHVEELVKTDLPF